ncbi:MAG: S-layer homology domain-containing protein [Candidatus Gracilibacteria bacterium]
MKNSSFVNVFLIFLMLMTGTFGGFFVKVSPASASFTDVPENHEHYAAILWLEGRSVIQGYEDGTFKPDQEVTRAEALKIVLLGSGIEVPEVLGFDETYYSDISLTDWFTKYVVKATDMEIVKGYDDQTFKPNQTVNLAEALKIIMQTNALTAETPTENPYVDVPFGDWYAGYAALAKAKYLIVADGEGKIYPGKAMTRGDLAEIIYRLSYITENFLEEFPVGLNWPAPVNTAYDITFPVPTGWQIIDGTNGEVILWAQDEANGQVSFDRTTPNSARVVIRVDSNPEGLSGDHYFAQIMNGMTGYSNLNSNTTETMGFNVWGVEYSGNYETFKDFYVEMPNGFLTIQSTYGNGALNEQWGDFISAVLGGMTYTPNDSGGTTFKPSEAVEQARAAIQVDGQGQIILDLFSDRELIETDSIGVGTGPVDYYYSAWANVTLKYERSFDVILDVAEGNTTNF